MKKTLLLIASICLWQISFSQTISLDSVMNYVGKEITLCAKIQSISVSKREKKTTYINFGKPYPNQTFTVVIFEESLKNFSYIPAEQLKDKNVCITGKIILYKDKPEIIINKEGEIKVE